MNNEQKDNKYTVHRSSFNVHCLLRYGPRDPNLNRKLEQPI
jgi:hypothetical protein